MHRAKRVVSLMLALLLAMSLMGFSVFAAEPLIEAEIRAQPIRAGAQPDSGLFSAPEGAPYHVIFGDASIIAYAGSPNVVHWLEPGEALEDGHVYSFSFLLIPAEGHSFEPDTAITVRNADSSYTPVLEAKRFVSTNDAGYYSFRLEYAVGCTGAPQDVEELHFASSGSFAPVVGQPLAQSLSVTSVPEDACTPSSAVRWTTAAPNGTETAASGNVRAGMVYYRPQFVCVPTEGFRFLHPKFFLNGEAMPDSMQLVIKGFSTPDEIVCDRYRYYGIRVETTAHGRASAPDYAAGGELVQLTAVPDAGYALAGWVVKDQRGNLIEIAADNTFRMPDPLIAEAGDTRLTVLTVTPYFAQSQPQNPFVDVATNKFYYEPVLWAVNHDPQITRGKDATHFKPNDPCTRGEVVTFLWRAMGEPAPKATICDFKDVKTSAFYYKAVLWAVENGITKGTSDTTFDPNEPCTRGHVVTFLYRAKQAVPVGGDNPFTDVPAGKFYTDAVLWAVKNKITNGTGGTLFSPGKTCTRGEIVTFLQRADTV